VYAPCHWVASLCACPPSRDSIQRGSGAVGAFISHEATKGTKGFNNTFFFVIFVTSCETIQPQRTWRAGLFVP
jgi:hypothetical protein